MKTRLLATLLLAAVAPAFAAEPPCATPAHRAFDFWIGTWDVARPDGTLAGRNRIEAVLGGCKDAGRNWQTLFDGRYTRVKGAAPRPQ